jgi:MoaA/NifB/PqqE/SkfB family radical SAM enzyme
MNVRTPAKLALRVLQQRLGQHRPLVATLLVTARCNVRCDGCVYYDNLDDRVTPVEESTERALLILRKLAEARLPSVSFAGGEPFLRADLPVLLRAGRAHGFSQSLVTNAMVLTAEGIAAAEETCDEVIFSPHPPSELGGGGAEARYARSWEGLARLRAGLHRAKLTCAIALGKHTAPVLDEILARAFAVGVDRVKYHPNFFPEQFPSTEVVARMGGVLRRWTDREPRRMQDPALFLDRLPTFFGPRPVVACTADRRFNVGVFLDGTVSACCAAHVPIGNLLEEPLGAMLDARIEGPSDCFGCHRVDAVRMLQVCGA